MAAGTQVERRVIGEVDVRSAVRVAAALALSIVAVVFVGLVALYLLGLVSGAVGGVERFFESLGYEDFSFNPISILPVFIVVSALWTALVAGGTAVFAVLYNILADLVGGVELTTREDASPPR